MLFISLLLAKKIIKNDIQPDFALVEVDPVLFSTIAIKYSIAYSYDFPFMFQNTEIGRKKPRNPLNIKEVLNLPGNGFSADELETFLLKNLFALYKYPPNFRAIKKNKEVVDIFSGITGLEHRKTLIKFIATTNKENLEGFRILC